jgi:hypothetical protein
VEDTVAELGTPAQMLRVHLRWAVEHGVDFHSPFEDDGPAWSPGAGRTPVELARLHGDVEIADYLVTQGAAPSGP